MKLVGFRRGVDAVAVKGGRLLRAVVAMVAAYAFALQMLFAGIVTAQAAGVPADPFAICASTDTSTDSGHTKGGAPVAHQSCIVCTVAPAASLPTFAIDPVAFRFGVAVSFQPAPAPLDIAIQSHNPRSSQGPPQHV